MKNIKKIKIDGVEYGLIPKVKDENGYLLVDNDGIYIDFEALKLALEVGSQTLPDKIKTIEDILKGLLKADETLSSQFTASLEKKQNVIEDLEIIRSGATKGATALQEIPEEYVTESELALKNFLTEHQSLEHLATKEEVRGIENKIPSLGGYATEQWVNEQDFLTEHQSLEHLATKEQLENKVDKVDGKQLSTEDFTTILKTKLEALNNYDDSALISRIDTIQDNIDTLFNKDVSSAIESFNEIIAFLNGIEDSEDLDSIIASIEQQIAKKQEKISDLETIRSGAALGATAIQKVKTINGQSIEGEGDITIDANTEEIYKIIESNEKVTAAALTDLDGRMKTLSGKSASASAEIEALKSGKATKEELASAVATLEEANVNLIAEIRSNEKVAAAALNDLNERKANTDYVDNAIASAITNTLNTEV